MNASELLQQTVRIMRGKCQGHVGVVIAVGPDLACVRFANGYLDWLPIEHISTRVSL